MAIVTAVVVRRWVGKEALWQCEGSGKWWLQPAFSFTAGAPVAVGADKDGES
jgi:hypothetical protein